MRNILILFAIVLFSGCASTEDCTNREEKKAAKSFLKGMDKCPRTMAEMAALVWPVRIYDSTVIKYLPGTETVVLDTLIYTDTLSKETIRTIYKTVYKTDTFYQWSDKQGENTAGISALNAKIKSQDAEIGALKNELSSKDERLKLLYWISGALGIYTLGRWVLRIWGIKLP